MTVTQRESELHRMSEDSYTVKSNSYTVRASYTVTIVRVTITQCGSYTVIQTSTKAKFLSMLICTANTGLPGAANRLDSTILSLKKRNMRSSVIPNGILPMYSLRACRVIWLAAGNGGGGTGKASVACPRAGGGIPAVGT